MPGKVLHISDELHAQIRAYCANKGIRISDWAEEAVSQAFLTYLEKDRPRVAVVKVEKRDLQPLIQEEPHAGPRPWELAPFWERGGYYGNEEEWEDDEMEAGGDGSGCGGGGVVAEDQ